MRFTPPIETQLGAAANAADRANRPTLLVVAPALLLLGAIVLVLVTNHRFSVAKSALSARLAERARVDQLIEYASELEAANPDVGVLFPPDPFLDVKIADVAQDVWGEGGPVTVSGKSSPRAVGLARQIAKSDVDVSWTTPLPIDELFTFIYRVLNEPEMTGHVFLARINIKPLPGGWIGSARFRLYERAQ
jgi:hypothetical protein